MRFTVFLCILVSCLLSLASARRKLKSEDAAGAEVADEGAEVADKDAFSDYKGRVKRLKSRPADFCQVDVARTVEGTGMHRELVTRVFLDEARFTWCIHNNPDSNWMGSAVCNIHIEEHFPSSVFLDPFELKGIEPVQNVRAYPRTEIDLEIPNELAEPLAVDMLVADVWPPKDERFYPIGMDHTIRVPFHVRYHAASENATSQTVVIPPPAKVAFKCVKPRIRYEGPASERYHMLAPHGVNILKAMELPPQPLVQTFFNDKEFISMIVPADTPTVTFEASVGDLGHQFFVSPVTSLVSISAMVIILLGIYRTRQKMKNDANMRKAVEASLKDVKEAKKEK